MASSMQAISGVASDDVIYIYLPLYHTAGFMMGLTGAIERGTLLYCIAQLVRVMFWQRPGRGFNSCSAVYGRKI